MSDSEYFISDESDHEILMHREAHFGGNFDAMLEYYSKEQPENQLGVNPDFDIERIEYLARVEKELNQNLAALMLLPDEVQKVAFARSAYKAFKKLYEIQTQKTHLPQLIANLILTEDENPEAEIEAIASFGSTATPDLIRILQSEDAYDPLFPGYGYAPYFAALCLAKIQDPRAIAPLFEAIGHRSVFGDEVFVSALTAHGAPARDFLIARLRSKPLSLANEHAVYALSAFTPDEKTIQICHQLLQDPEVLASPYLTTYLRLHTQN